MKVWIDGEIVDGAEARIPVTDHGLLYGDGIFEGIRVYGGHVFRLDAHLERFAVGARALCLELRHEIPALREIVLETARAFAAAEKQRAAPFPSSNAGISQGGCDAAESYIRLIATRGEGALGIDPTLCAQPRLICIVDHISVYPEEKQRRGIDLLTSSLRRPPADVLDPRIKSLNYLNNVLAKLEAKQRGADEALLLNLAGTIAEASVANVFAVRRGELLTPPATDGALEGITRATVLELAASLGIPAAERTLGRFDLFAANEAFLSGSGAGIVPIRSLDSRAIGSGVPGPVYEKIRAAFLEAAPSLGVSF